MALTQENGTNGSGSEPPTPKASKVRWFSTLLPSSGNDNSTLMSTSSSSLGLAVEDVETEEAIEVGEDLELDDRNLSLAFNCPRHVEEIHGSQMETQSWRMRERMKTVSVALVVCLNLGIDPPDVMKTRPCARVESWVDPQTLNSQRATENIGKNLQNQYERWQPRARYRLSLDPTVEEVRRLATGLRRNAGDERVLFHYNGHGVPKPTANGEIWVFNRNYTQYIPLSLYDLQSWMGSPSIFVYDCSNAGIVVTCFEQFAEQHEEEYLEQVNARGVSSSELPAPISPRSCIQLAACSANQILPMHPDLPADLFTACLTTPIRMALRWFVMQNQGKLSQRITLEMLGKIPGQFGDRRTMLGELNWIFTAITDTIAWNTLPRPLFRRLFRQDLLVASLFRNFLLGERVMRSYDCSPVSQPALPPTHQHNMWHAWDLAVDIALAQLPAILDSDAPYKASTFFEEELTAFEVWLKYGNERRPPPEQLPVVLQVLLSQAHRLRALDLLGRFLDLGPWAVNLALSVGIFPYVLKLLQSSARELRPLLVSIWAKILAVDSSCQSDLVRDGSHRYFINVLQDDSMLPAHRTWAAFILACIVHDYRVGQQEAEQSNLIAICLEHLENDEPVFRQWLAVAVGREWDHYETARWRGARDNAHEKLYELLKDPVPEVRAAAVFALGTFINSCEERTEHANNLDHAIALHLLKAGEDGSPLVRCELVVALQYIVLAFNSNFVNVCRAEEEENNRNATNAYSKTLSPASSGKKSSKNFSTLHPSASVSCLDRMTSPHQSILSTKSAGSLSVSMSGLTFGNVYSKIFNALVNLSHDPHPEVSSMATKLVEYLRQKAKDKEAAAAARAAHLEISSMPSSPARQKFMAPPTITRPLTAGHVSTIAEESSAEILSSSADARQPSSFKDMNRSFRGRSEGRHPSGGQHATATIANNSLNSTASVVQASNALTNGHRAVSVIPAPSSKPPPQLVTNFVSWSAKYFSKQLMEHECGDCDCDHESGNHWRREWLFLRNNEVRVEGELQCSLLREKRGRLDGPVSSIGASSVLRNVPSFTPSAIMFHPFSDEVVVAGQSSVTIWNSKQSRRISLIEVDNRKSNSGHHTSSSISSLEYLNSHDDTLLLVGCEDGSIRIYKDYATEPSDDDSKSDDGELGFHNSSEEINSKFKLISAWNGLKDLGSHGIQTSHRSNSLATLASSMANLSIKGFSQTPVKTAWSQADLTLAVGGAESKYIRLWDANQELRRADISTGTDAPLTRLSYGPPHLGLMCAGFADGTVRLFDTRSPDARVMSFDGLDGHVYDCRLKGDERKSPVLVCGDSNGCVQYYELRMPQSFSRSSKCLASITVSPTGQSIMGMTIHQQADLFAVWAQQSVSLHYFNPYLCNGSSPGSSIINVIKYHDEGVLGQRLGYEGCLAFHPILLQVAVGSRDGALSLKGFKKS